MKCTKCNDIFKNRHDLKYHVKRIHQSSVKVKFQTGRVAEVKKEVDGMFKCTCGKGFKIPWSLQKHAKGCDGESTESHEEEAEAELMDVNDSDMSELMNMDQGWHRVERVERRAGKIATRLARALLDSKPRARGPTRLARASGEQEIFCSTRDLE
jgi:hypothetical protein